MAIINYPVRTASGKENVTSLALHKRSTCAVVIFPWKNSEITNLLKQDISSKGISSPKISETFEERKRINIINDVIGCNITKSKSSSSGTFSISLKRGKVRKNGKTTKQDIDYLKVIHPGDWIAIYIKRGTPYKDEDLTRTDLNSGLRMIGVVENVRYVEIDDPGSASPRLEYVVTGKDFGKVFESNIYFNPQIADSASILLGVNLTRNSDNVLKVNKKDQQVGIDAAEAVKRVVNFYLGAGLDQVTKKLLQQTNVTHQSWYIPPSLASHLGILTKQKGKPTFVDVLKMSKLGLHKYTASGLEVKKLLSGTIPLTMPTSGTIWSSMQYVQNPVMNEMYTELTLGTKYLHPTLILRQYPFSNKKEHETNVFTSDITKSVKDPNSNNEKTFFTSLPAVSILSSDIKQKNVGKSDFERINHVMVVPQIPVDGSTLDLAFKSILNTASIQRYGIKSYQAPTSHLFSSNKENFLKLCEKATAHLADWFFMSHLLYNGTIITQGMNDHIELGFNLHITDVGQLYHIEGYSHSYSVNADGSTSYTIEFNVSRGQTFKNGKLGFIGPSKYTREPTTISYSTTEGSR